MKFRNSLFLWVFFIRIPNPDPDFKSGSRSTYLIEFGSEKLAQSAFKNLQRENCGALLFLYTITFTHAECFQIALPY